MTHKVQVRIEGSDRLITCPVNPQTRIWQLGRHIATELGEVPSNVEIVAADRGLDPLSRVIGYEGVQLWCRLGDAGTREPPPIGGPRTPRLVEVQKPPERCNVRVTRRGCEPVRVTVNLDDSISVLRSLCNADGPSIVICVRKRRVVDERQSFRQLGLMNDSAAIELRDESDLDTSSRLSANASRRPVAAPDLAESYQYDGDLAQHGPDAPAADRARRRFAHHVRILFEDPDDEGFTYELYVHNARTIGSLLQFVEAEPGYAILCDGKDLPAATTFLEATEGYDGTHFTFVPTKSPAEQQQQALREASVSRRRPIGEDEVVLTPVSHLTRPFSPPQQGRYVISPSDDRRSASRSVPPRTPLTNERSPLPSSETRR